MADSKVLVQALKEVDWPEEFPFSAKDFERYDE
jgi:hypothetical protein